MEIKDLIREINKDPLKRAMSIVREDMTADETDRTVKLAFVSNAPVEQWFGTLQLSFDKKAIRTERLKSGAPLLMDHNPTDLVGVVETFSFDKDGKGRANVRFSKEARGTSIFNEVVDKIRRNVSVGFLIHDMEVLEPGTKGGLPSFISNDWEPYEISLVSIPADISVGVGRSKDLVKAKVLEKKMNLETEEEIQTPAARAKQFVEFGEIFGKEDLARTMALNADATLDDLRAAIRAEKTAEPQVMPLMHPADEARRFNDFAGFSLARTNSRMGGKLQGFRGEKAEEQAYRFGNWIAGHLLGNERARQWCSSHGIRSMNEGENAKGGYTVPIEFGADLIDLVEQYGVFRANTLVVPMASDTRYDPLISSELDSQFVGESEEGDEQDFTYGQIGLIAKKHKVLTVVSSEVNEDSIIAFGDQAMVMAARAFAKKEDLCGFIADGTSPYGGIVGVTERLKGLDASPANIAGLQVGSGNAYSELTIGDFLGVAARLPEYADQFAKWFVSKSFYYNTMCRVALAAGGVTAKEIEDQRTRTFLGYSVVFAQVMPKVEANDQVCAILGDLTMGARLGDRRIYTMALSDQARFAQDDLMLKATARFDINIHSVGNASASADERQAGPIVGLITAGS